MIRKGCKIQSTCFSKFMQVRLNGSRDFLMHSSNYKKKLKGRIVKFVFLLTRILAMEWGRSWCVLPFAHWDCAAKGWPWLAAQDLPPPSEPLVPLWMTFRAFSTHPTAVSRRGAAQAQFPVSCWVESLSCLYWTWGEERPVVSSETSKRRKLLSSVSKFATSLGLCSNRGC